MFVIVEIKRTWQMVNSWDVYYCGKNSALPPSYRHTLSYKMLFQHTNEGSRDRN